MTVTGEGGASLMTVVGIVGPWLVTVTGGAWCVTVLGVAWAVTVTEVPSPVTVTGGA